MLALSLGNIIRQERQIKGMTQSQLAALLGISRQSLINAEQDKVSVSFETMARLQQILGISLDQIAIDLTPAASWQWWPEMPLQSGPVVAAAMNGQLIVSPIQATLTQDVSNGWWDMESGQIHWYSHNDISRQIFAAGCDPYLPWLVRAFHEHQSAYRLIPFSMASEKAVNSLRRGVVHLAGSHLYNPQEHTYNHIARHGEKWLYIGYLDWEEGRVYRSGSSQGEQGESHQWALREPGSEALALFYRHCAPQAVNGDQIRHFLTHRDLVSFVHSSGIQGVSIGSLAHLQGLSFEPWATEHFEWIAHMDNIEKPWLKAFMAVLEHSSLSRQLEALPYQNCSNWARVRQD